VRIRMFYHTLLSDWNHGNAHFLRGIATELISRGHEVRVYEPADSWSRRSLIAEHGKGPIEAFYRAYPYLEGVRYDDSVDLESIVRDADLVIVHEWNDH
jgi:spore maturation protein CgeB